MTKKAVSIKKPQRETVLAFAEAKKAKKGSMLIPDGDVRMTANIRADLHRRLKVEAVMRQTTIGELLEGFIENNIP
jgi:hypothetical protein